MPPTTVPDPVPGYVVGLGPLASLPDFELNHIVADIDVRGFKWSTLSKEDKAAVKAEDDRRKGLAPSDDAVVLELKKAADVAEKAAADAQTAAVEARAKADKVEADAKAAKEAKVAADAAAAAVPAATDDVSVQAAAVAAGTVDEAAVVIAAATTKAQLDAYDKAEKAGKDRIGVRDLIEKKRTDLGV